MQSRRQVLGAMAALSALSAPSGAIAASVHADADLLRAWADYLSACRTRDALPDDTSDRDLAPYYRAIDDAAGRVHALPARTPAGLAVKLRWLWSEQVEAAGAYDVIVHGAPVTPALLTDWRDRMLWSLIGDAEAQS